MCSCSDDAGNGLTIDTAEVRERQSMLFQLTAQVSQSNSCFDGYGTGVRVDIENAIEVVEVDEPGRGASDVGGRVAAANCYQSSTTTPGEGDQLLDLWDCLWTNVQLRAGKESLGPCVMEVVGR